MRRFNQVMRFGNTIPAFRIRKIVRRRDVTHLFGNFTQSRYKAALLVLRVVDDTGWEMGQLIRLPGDEFLRVRGHDGNIYVSPRDETMFCFKDIHILESAHDSKNKKLFVRTEPFQPQLPNFVLP